MPSPRLGNAGSVYAEQERKLEELLASDAYDWEACGVSSKLAKWREPIPLSKR